MADRAKSKTKRIIEWMENHPPKEGEDGYYEKVAKRFSSTANYVRQLAQESGVPNVRSTKTALRTGNNLKESILTLLAKSKKDEWSTLRLAEHFDVPPSHVRQALEDLRSESRNIVLVGENVQLSHQLPVEAGVSKIDTRQFQGQTMKFGVTADNHLCSNYERLDVLNALFDIWQQQGITEVLQLGNMIDGEARFNQFELKVRGVEGQTRYFLEHWPRRKGMRTRFIAGDDHEGWYVQREGMDIGKYIAAEAKRIGRDDLEYLGYMEHDLVFGTKGNEQVIRLMHAGGGSAYAISYSVQKIVESLQGGEKPTIMLVGHFHKYNVSYPRGVYTVQAGCTVDQTPFMRKKRLEAHLGGVTLEFDIGKDGLFHNITHRWHPFFDRDFYDKNWRYRGA